MQHYPRTATTVDVAVMEPEALARARYLAYAQRRTMPPRCNPFGILILVLALGMMFIGLTMTIIANWPGATSIGDNPLRVAGPVLLGVGGGILILSIFIIVLLNNKEQAKWESKLANLAAGRNFRDSSSREVLVPRSGPTDDMAYRTSLKPGGGSITTGSKNGGVGQRDDPSTSRSSSAYAAKGRYSSSTVEMLPDPNRKAGDNSEKLHDLSLDSGSNIPDPMRVQKKRQTSRKSESSNGSVNHSYSSGAGEADLGVPGMLMPSRTSHQNNAFSNAVYENIERGYRRENGTDDDSAAAATARQRSKAYKDSQELRPGSGSSDPIREAIARGTAQVYSTEQLQQQQQLRVHIKAQPGTAVHITPSATPPQSRLSQQRPGRQLMNTSGETEI